MRTSEHLGPLSVSFIFRSVLYQRFYCKCQISQLRCLSTGLAVLDDDSGKLGEVVELFSDITPTVKVEKLVKVSPQ